MNFQGLKVVKPKRDDARWPLVAFLLAFVAYALLSPGFSRRPEQYLVDALVCVGLDMFFGWTKGLALVPLSGFITSMGTLLLCDSPTVWAYALVAALSIFSKQLIRVEGKHIFNPNNFGIVVAMLFFSDNVTVLSSRWGGDGRLMAVIVALGIFAAHRAGRLRLAATYVITFALGTLARKFMSGAPYLTAFAPMTGAGFMLFTFYMITDPMTTLGTPGGQLAFGVAVGVLDNCLRFRQINNAPFYALFAVTAVVPLARGMSYDPAPRKPALGESHA